MKNSKPSTDSPAKVGETKVTEILEWVVPDGAVSEWEEFFIFRGIEVRPEEVRTLTQGSAEVLLNGVCFSADQEAMAGYPAAGRYYLTNKN